MYHINNLLSSCNGQLLHAYLCFQAKHIPRPPRVLKINWFDLIIITKCQNFNSKFHACHIALIYLYSCLSVILINNLDNRFLNLFDDLVGPTVCTVGGGWEAPWFDFRQELFGKRTFQIGSDLDVLGYSAWITLLW